MDAKSYIKWQKIADEFLNGDMDEVEFCKAKKIDVELFRRRLREVENYDEQENAGSREDNLFMELIPQGNEDSKVIASDILQVKFHDAVFELKSGFSIDVFRQALQIVKEVL